jgi:hypothetical protein
MTTKEELLTELSEMKNQIKGNNYIIDQADSSLKKIESEIINSITYEIGEKSNIIKSFLVTFNVSNFSDFTVLFVSVADGIKIMEYAGSDFLFDEFTRLIETERAFFRDVDSIKVKGDSFRIFFESMENDNGRYTILTITESPYFKPSLFHMLSDILMDIIRSTNMVHDSVFNDLFEETAIGINSYIAANSITSSEYYLFKFENIYDFFLKMGLEIIIELSETIKKKLTEIFGVQSSIFRYSLSKYIVVSSAGASNDDKFSDLNNSNTLYFDYKGIVLKHHCIKIPYKKNQSVYDIFENIYLIDDNIKK